MGGSYSPVSSAINAKFKIFNYNGNVDGFGESGTGLDMFSYSNQWNFVKADGTSIGTFGLNKFSIGNQSGGVTVPTYLDLGSNYNSVEGDSVNLKIKLNTNRNAGIGVSAALGNQYWGNSHTFYSNAGIASFKNLRIEQTGEMILQKGGTFANTGDLLQVSGSLNLKTAGSKILIATGSNASVGTATLAAGTITINTSAVTANSLIFVGYQGAPTTVTSVLTVPTITAGTSFVITALTAGGTATAITDNNLVKWWIIN